MKKNLKRAVAILLSVLMLLALAGCGPKKPTADDAKAYVKAVLDMICTGDYDHSIKLADIEEGTELEVRDEMIDELVSTMGSSQSLSEEVQNGFKDFLTKAFAKAKYEVTDAVETEDGGYDVTVSIEPLRIFAAEDGSIEDKVLAKAMENPAAYMGMSESEITNSLLLMMIDMLNENLENPLYADKVDVVVHYGLLDEEENLYGCSEAEGQKLGEKLFSE